MLDVNKYVEGMELRDILICFGAGLKDNKEYVCGNDAIYQYNNIDNLNYGDYIFIGISNGINVYIDKFWFKYGMIRKGWL